MERRNDDLLSSYNLDKDKIGMYNICYTRNFWDSLEPVKLYQVPPRRFRTIYLPVSFSFLTIRLAWRAETLTVDIGLRLSMLKGMKRTSSVGQICRRQT